MPDQRAAPRYAQRLSLQIASEPEGRFEIETRDVSLTGACCRSRYYVPLMTRLQVTLIVPGQRPSEPLRAEAVVVRVHPCSEAGNEGSYDLALYFTRMRPEDQNRLGSYLQNRTGGAA